MSREIYIDITLLTQIEMCVERDLRKTDVESCREIERFIDKDKDV